MLSFSVITLFPELIREYCQLSIIGRGVKAGKISIESINPRDFCQDKYRKVDDTPYGGGAGMVLKPEPFFAAFESIQRPDQSPVILATPQGSVFNANQAVSFSKEQHLTILCGHYEGFDERIRTLATHEISIGDFVLTGGELAALVIIDAVSRFIPGVVGKHVSVLQESFTDGLLEGPQYTKPPEFRGMIVPEIIRSGDHKAMEKWRREQALKRTFERRPDLLSQATLDKDDLKFLDSLK